MGVIATKYYYCLLCDKERFEGEAECGCVKSILYECPICRTSYESEFDAKHCCEQFEVSDAFVCQSCGDWQYENFSCDCEDCEDET